MAPKETAYYDLLQVSPTATAAEIRKSFRTLALKHHPDRAGNTPEATAHFQQLRAVHDLLLDPDRRAAYDAEGDDGTLHGGDPVDTEAAAAFFASAGIRVTEEEIIAYEARYRDSDEEREDLSNFFNRFNGAVDTVLDFIPYSEETDLARFVEFWDTEISKDVLKSTKMYKSQRNKLLKIAGDKKRDLSAPTEKKKGKKGKKGRGKKKAKDDELSLVSQILAKRKSREENFDSWADGLAARAEQRATAQRKKTKRKSPAKSKHD